jgi:hypothetical protein
MQRFSSKKAKVKSVSKNFAPLPLGDFALKISFA